MTGKRLLLILFVSAAVWFVAFVWPTRYRSIGEPTHVDGVLIEQRVDRFTGAVEQRRNSGDWAKYRAPLPEYDVRLDSGVGQAVDRAQRAGETIRAMNEAASKAMDRDAGAGVGKK